MDMSLLPLFLLCVFAVIFMSAAVKHAIFRIVGCLSTVAVIALAAAIYFGILS